MLKYTNIEYADDTNNDKGLNKLAKNKIRKKSQTSAGFTIENDDHKEKSKPGTELKQKVIF